MYNLYKFCTQITQDSALFNYQLKTEIGQIYFKAPPTINSPFVVEYSTHELPRTFEGKNLSRL